MNAANRNHAISESLNGGHEYWYSYDPVASTTGDPPLADALCSRMSHSRSERASESHIRALRASAGGKECADAYISFVQKREAFLEVAKSHGLKRGIKDYDHCLKKLRAHCNKLSARFRLEECCNEDCTSSSSTTKQGSRSRTADQGSQTAGAAANGTSAAAGTGVPLQQAVSNGPRAPPPPPPPLPGLPLIAKPGAGKAAAAATTPAKAPPAPPPPPPAGPPPLPRHAAPGTQHHGQQETHSSSCCTAVSTGAAAARPPPPPPPPPLPPGFGRGKAPAAAVTAAQGPATRIGPPPPPPGPPPSAAALRVTGPVCAEFAAGRCANTAEQPAGMRTPPPPPPLPKQLRPSATASEGMQGLAAVAAAAAAAAVANNVSAGSNSPAAEQEGLPLVSSSSSAAIAGGKLKTLHVDPVPVHRLADGSFWKVADPVAKPFKDSMEYLLRTMFSDVPRSAQKHHHHHHHSPRTSTPGTPGGASGATDGSAEAMECEVVTCVPEKRALHVEVVLKRLHMPAAALAAAINLLNTDKLKPDDLASIRSILPKPEELQAVREAKETAEKKAAALSPRTPTGAVAPSTPPGSSTAHSEGCAAPSALSPRLGVVEAAFDALGSVELLQAKMRAMEFRYDVESVASLVYEYARDIGHSLDVLRVSGQLQYLLAFVRDVANTMNRAGPKGPLAGFKLESLARLQSTKMAGATDLNLLHYIVAHMSAVLPGVLVLDAEREAFRSACRRGTFDTVTVRIRTLLDTQKRLSADLAAAKKLQQQRCSQLGSTPEAAASRSSSNSAAAGVVGSGSANPCSGSSSDSHDIYVARLTELLDNAGPKIDELQQQLDDVITKFKWTAEYYCEDVKGQAWKQQPVAFLTHFLELLDSLAATQKDTARLARVTSMLAEYVAAQQMWQQRQVLLEQDLLEQQEPQEQTVLDLEDPQRQQQEHQMLLQQQELLRQHLEASERLHKQNGSSSSLASDLPAGVEPPDEEAQQPQQGTGSGASSVNSSAEHTQLYDAEDAAQYQHSQHKPACVPRLDLGHSSKGESAPAADAVCPEQSWGSVDSADHAGHASRGTVSVATKSAISTPGQPLQEDQQHTPRLLSCASPSQQPAHAGSAEEPSVDDLHGEEQQPAPCNEQHSSLTAIVMDEWSPRHSLGMHSVNALEEDNSNSSSAMADAAGQLAAEAAAVARRRAGATALSRSLDSGMFAAVHSWQSKEEASAEVVATERGKRQPDSSSNAAKPQFGSSTHGSYSKAHMMQSHQQQKLGLRQPWRPAGQKSSGQHQQRGKAGVMSPVSLRKRPQVEEQLAREAAAVIPGRPKSASPTSGKLSVQQQRLVALRLRGKRGTPELQKQQHQAAEAGGLTHSFENAEDPREKLARLLQSSIDSLV